VTADDGLRIQGATLQAIATLDFSNDDGLEDIKKVMRRLLRIHLGGKPLNSRNLFDTLVQPAS
jgi:recombinational DNA repair protein (RecF pathway)